MAEEAELNRVAALADQLAERMLTEFENRVLTTEEFGREVALIAKVAAMLQDAGLELPPGIHLGRRWLSRRRSSPDCAGPTWV